MLTEQLCASKSGVDHHSSAVFDGESNCVNYLATVLLLKVEFKPYLRGSIGAAELHLLPSQVGIVVLRQICGSKSGKKNVSHPVFDGESNGDNSLNVLSLHVIWILHPQMNR